MNSSQLMELESSLLPLRTAIMPTLCWVTWEGKGLGVQCTKGSPQQRNAMVGSVSRLETVVAVDWLKHVKT